MAEKDFKVKNGLFVTDSASVDHLRIRSDGIVDGNLTVVGSIIGASPGFDSDFSTKTTDSLAEGDINLYYTTARADSAFDVKFLTKTTDSLGEGSSNLYYTTARADSAFDVKFLTKTTDSLAEGDNLYYTTARADSDAKNAISGGSNITVNNTTGVISLDSSIEVSLNYIDFTPKDPEPSHLEGRVFYHDEYKALTVYNSEADISLQVGQEERVRVRNVTGSTISAGTPVYVTGASGETLTVAPSDATTEEKSRAIGLAAHSIENNTNGFVTVRGLVPGLNTSGLTVGEPVHISASGALQTAAPTYPYFPTEIGWCVVSDTSAGYIYVTETHHTFEQFRVSGNTHMDGNLTVDGDFTVNGTQSIVSQANLALDNAFIYLNSGDTIGDANTTFSGTGLDDAYFTGHFEGTDATTYYVRIDGVGTGTGGVDTFEWSKNNFSTTEATGVDISATADVVLDNNIKIHFNATTGHTSGDTWSGTAAPLNVDTGWFTNYNTGDSGVGYTHAGIFFDTTDYKFKVVADYASEPEGNIAVNDSSDLGILKAREFEGSLTGTVSSIANHTTDSLGEGDNLFYTTARADSAFDVKFLTKTTDSLGEGTSNLYYTTARFDSDFSTGGTFTSNVKFNDNVKAIFGTGDDLQIYHNGVSNIIEDVGTGGLTLRGNNVYLQDDSNGGYGLFAQGLHNGAFELYYDNSKKFETTSTGATLTGGLVSDSATITLLTLNGLSVDSAWVKLAADSDYVKTAANETHIKSIADSDYIKTAADSDYIQTAVTETLVRSLADSAYVKTVFDDTFTVSATGTTFVGEITADSATFTNLTRTSTATAGVYGSASAIPVVTIDSSGFVDSIGTVTVDIPASYTDDNVDSHLSGGTGISYNGGVITLDSTAVSAGSYGDSSNIPAFTVNEQGQITAVSLKSLNIPTGYTDANVDSHVSGGVGITYTSGEIKVDSAEFLSYIAPSIDHNALTNWDSNKHIDHTAVSITAGNLLTGGGTIAATRTLSVDSSGILGLFSAAGDLSYNSSTGEFSITAPYDSANSLLTALKTVDGAGSGLDADTLDGQEGTYYRIDVYDASGTLLN